MPTQISTVTRTVVTQGAAPADVTYTDRGTGRPFLILHGGAGPRSVLAFADLLASAGPGRVIVPVHPGFDGTPRPDDLTSIRGLARLYESFLADLDLTDVIVIGNSIGGWITAELALLGSPRISGVVLVDAVGLAIEAHPVVDFFTLTMDQVADLSYYRPDAFRLDLSSMPDEQKAIMAANRAALAVYGGTEMADHDLLGRLPQATIPALVVWGSADRIVPPEHGKAYAAAMPASELHIIETAGHLPQLEEPEKLLDLIRAFTAAQPAAGPQEGRP